MAVGGAATGNNTCPFLACVSFGVVGESVSVGLAAFEARVCWMSGWGNPGGVSVCPFGSDSVASSGGGEPRGDWGKGYVVSLLEFGRMTKVGSFFHPML